MPDVPAAVAAPLILLAVGLWALLLADVVRDPLLGRRARRAWVVAFLVLWVAAPVAWAAVRVRRALKAAGPAEVSPR